MIGQNVWMQRLLSKFYIFDFAKAFNVVAVPKLIIKLQHYGFGGLLLSCIISFLKDRIQKVKVGTCSQVIYQ